MPQTEPSPRDPDAGYTEPEHDPTTPHIAQLNLSHPKNYLGVPLAVYADGATTRHITDSLVQTVGHARLGAEELGLITREFEVGSVGQQVVAVATDEFETSTAALSALEDLKRSHARLAKKAPFWARLGQRVYQHYLPADSILTALADCGAVGISNAVTLPDLVTHLTEQNISLTSSICLQNGWELAQQDQKPPVIHSPNGREHPLTSGNGYSGQFQHLKSHLYHVGFVTDPGVDTATLDPTADRWALTEAGSAVAGSGGDRDAE
ncbi:hypothetical protein SAMN05216388_102542 [Halorientalis persicus]|uniref:Uncharacterized protein n=1 Tax=Halorientalis persicus TaxID=1367881 RepID=A0A1H8U4J6_9EURY|nr:hypothetical protein [Halorientalis persicus]SEO97753.1 hypothetical protein SAMN05216388_102542 [Halorientalis persicus]